MNTWRGGKHSLLSWTVWKRQTFPVCTYQYLFKCKLVDYFFFASVSSNTIFSFELGTFTSAIYAEDCIFEDPTIRFRGKKAYGGFCD